MIRDHSNYLLYENNVETQTIWRASDPEFDAHENEIMRIFNNTRASISDIEGIIKWERVFGIFPDVARDTIDERRDRVLEAMRTSPPFTEPWLELQIYQRFPQGGVSYSLARLILTVYMDMEDVSLVEMPRIRRNLREFLAWLRTWIPCNLLVFPRPTVIRNFPQTELYTGVGLWRMTVRNFKVEA